MDANLIIATIAMVATVISTVIAFIQAKKCEKIKEEMIVIRNETNNLFNQHKNKTTITNDGTNSGVIAKNIKGGVEIGK
ncbi:hypothetical protein [Metasolibacillus sp. FSL K6-0083]|uniref:hypothetical protein n=1 Tax=Metasolibacillus sp. FSL K6-0083 TaxID=2921416 RepID=UPI00315AA39F